MCTCGKGVFPFLEGSHVEHFYAIDGLFMMCGSVNMFKIGGCLAITVVVVVIVVIDVVGISCAALCEESLDISKTKNQ